MSELCVLTVSKLIVDNVVDALIEKLMDDLTLSLSPEEDEIVHSTAKTVEEFGPIFNHLEKIPINTHNKLRSRHPRF